MKRVVIIVAIITLVLFAVPTGRSVSRHIINDGINYINDNFDPEISRTIKEEDTKVATLKAEVDDPAFWDTAESEAKLVSNLLERNQEISVTYRLSVGDQTVISPAITVRMDHYANSKWRKIVIDELLYTFATVSDVERAYNAGQNPKITGVIANWIDSAHHETVSVCDLNADGVWDYVTLDALRFTGLPGDSYFGISCETTGTNNNKRIPINKSKISITQLAKLVFSE